MRRFHSEFVHSYGTYTFGYGVYAQLEKGDTLSAVYDQGFLPYSGSKEVIDTLYMARSARVHLPEFDLSSENRRILKRFDGMFEKRPLSATDFAQNEALLEFALAYFANRHDAHVMPKERLMLILRHAVRPFGFQYERDGKVAAITLLDGDASMRHFWYSFYDISLVQQSLGMWLMLDAARDAKDAGCSHFYLGTVYGEKALYKTNFPALSWWDGTVWRNDLALLKEKARSDTSRTTAAGDVWKESLSQF